MMKKYMMLAVSLMAALLLALAGCGDEPAPETEIQQESTPDIFIEESEQLPRESTPPNLVIEAVSGEVASAFNATLGGYVWEWLDSSGRKEISEEEAPCAAEMKDIASIRRADTDGGVNLQITGGSLRTVRIWADGDTMEMGEKITVENNRIVFPESGAYRYEIVVDYTGGRVYYAFMVTE